jgi:peptide deformylase
MIVTDKKTLEQVSTPVTQEEVADLHKRLLDEVNSHDSAAGLSAIQLGVPKRLFITTDPDENPKDDVPEWCLWVNPEIESFDDETVEVVEGCLSFPQQFVLTKRHKQITVSTQNLENWAEREVYNLSGMEAVVFQHEFDHLNGTLMFDRGKIINVPIKSDKVGRNDPCTCGKLDSQGRPLKYKKCCGK